MRELFGEIRFLENREQYGLLRTRLRGVRESCGRYLAFVDSDDYVSPGFFGALYRRAEETDAEIVIGRTVREEEGTPRIYGLHEGFLPHRILDGAEARRRFFLQEGRCYAWHTIWNKLYRRELWDRCAAWMQGRREVITMTEDLCLSSMLFAQSPVTAAALEDPYHYCARTGAQTDTGGDSGAEILRKISEMRAAFAAAGSFLNELPDSDSEKAEILRHFAGCRAYYAGIWQGILRTALMTDAQREWGGQILLQLAGGSPGKSAGTTETGYCESIRIPYTGRTAYLRDRICGGPEKIISMDLYGTLVTRPFREPADLFLLLDQFYSGCTGSTAPFHLLRADAEKKAREQIRRLCGHEDVTIREIYETLHTLHGIPEELCCRMMEEECRLETLCAAPRKTGVQLLEAAVRSGRKVIIATDMYLPRECLTQILEKCGIRGWTSLWISSEARRLKSTGGLFRRICREEGIPASGLLHVGDSWEADIRGAEKAHVEAVYLPDAETCAKGDIRGQQTRDLGCLGEETYGRTARRAAERDLAFRCARALAVRTYFDDPYRDLSGGRGCGGDPFYLGYCVLGPFLLGCAGKIRSSMDDSGARTAVFLARDTDLLYKAAERLQAGGLFGHRILRIHASRDMLLPFMIRAEDAFAAMPVECTCHSPRSLRRLLARIDRAPAESSAVSARPFADRAEMMRFLRSFRDTSYCAGKHAAEYARYREYYRLIPESSLLIDVGYSGRIPEALRKLTGRDLPFLYLLGDRDAMRRSAACAKREGQGAVRPGEILLPYADLRIGPALEYLLSGEEGKCADIDAEMRPVYVRSGQKASSELLRTSVQEAALQYVDDWCRCFAELPFRDLPDISAAAPALLQFLERMQEEDRKMMFAAVIEDLVYGAESQASVTEVLQRDETGEIPAGEGPPGLPGGAEATGKLKEAVRLTRRGLQLLRRDPALFARKLAEKTGTAGIAHRKGGYDA